MKKIIIGVYNKSVILTYIGVIIAFLGMCLVKDNVNIAMACLVISGICDLFDGKIARMCKRTDKEKEFGIQIDSLADVVSFLVFPGIILSNICEYSLVTYIVGPLYLLAGIIRLGWFNITTDGSTKYYNGLPVTYSALILPVFYVIFFKILKLEFIAGMILPLIYILIAILFILNIKIKKPTGVWYIIFSILAVITIFLLFC